MTGATLYVVVGIAILVVIVIIVLGAVATRGFIAGRNYERHLWQDKHKHTKEILESVYDSRGNIVRSRR